MWYINEILDFKILLSKQPDGNGGNILNLMAALEDSMEALKKIKNLKEQDVEGTSTLRVFVTDKGKFNILKLFKVLVVKVLTKQLSTL